ncbi:TetR/AcrR family transcriptional regulator [Pseudonocardiaceae bacterium YIM PH 21723]|nr:TetR/AcrR family transcriptional regulator [Pseudonocardiaceae bacterium YIM PH 21723]
MQGALITLRERGIAGVSARTIAAAAGVNQGLVFYHFGSVDELLAAACSWGAEQLITELRPRFADIQTITELLDFGLELNEGYRRSGDVVMLAQALAGAQTDPKLRPAAAQAMDLWVAEIEAVLRRVLGDSVLNPLLDLPALSRFLTYSFVGYQLAEGVDEESAHRAIAALRPLGELLGVIDDLGPVATRVLRHKIRDLAGPLSGTKNHRSEA